jgi:hypothetical protein
MENSTKSRKAAELLAARRARMTALRRRCAASVLSTFVIAFSVLTIDASTSTSTATTAAAVTTTASSESADSESKGDSSESTASVEDELPAVATSQS